MSLGAVGRDQSRRDTWRGGARGGLSRKGWAGLALFFVGLYLVPLGWRPLLLPDEFRYAEIPREMRVSGDWVTPHLNGLPYFEKPVLGYWLIAASESLFGENRFGVRFPSALVTGLTCLLVMVAVRRGGGRRRADDQRRVDEDGTDVAWLAGLVYLSMLLPVVLGVTAVLDAPLTLFLTGSLVAFFLATLSPRGSSRERWYLLLCGVSCGLAFLAKGFLALVLAAAVGGGYLLLQRRWRDLLRMPWIPIAAAILVAAPWSLLIHQRAPDFWRYFFWHEHVQRFLDSGGGQHPEPWWFFLAATPLVLLPWSFFVPAAARGLWRRWRGAGQVGELSRFCFVWVAAAYCFFSASSGKLLTYILPALPAVAILIALGLGAGGGELQARSWRRGGLVGGAIFGLIAVGGAIGVVRAGRIPALGPGWKAGGLMLSLALVGGLLAWAAVTHGRRRTAIAATALVPLLLTLQIALPDRVLASKAPGVFLAQQARDLPPETPVLVDADGARAAGWALRRSDLVILGSPGELRYGLENAPEPGREVTLSEARRLIRRHPEGVALIAPFRVYAGWEPLLPEPSRTVVDEFGGWVFVWY